MVQSNENLNSDHNRNNQTEGSRKENRNHEDNQISSMLQSQMNPRGTLYGESRDNINQDGVLSGTGEFALEQAQ